MSTGVTISANSPVDVGEDEDILFGIPALNE
jgi:hypothetical protein